MNEERWESVLNSIANGVEMRLHVQMGIPDIAIWETARLARQLEIPEDVIEEWAVVRKSQFNNVKQDIESLIAVLKKNEAARRLFSSFVPDVKPSGFDNEKMN